MEVKAELAELVAEAECLQQRQLPENKAEQLIVQEVYEEMEEESH